MAKAHKNANFVLGRTRGGTGKAGIGTVKTRIAIGKRNRGEVYHNRQVFTITVAFLQITAHAPKM